MAKDKAVRRDKIIKAAADLFFEKGFSTTSIDDIIKVTGGSKRNIYSEFGNKTGLLSVIIETYTQKIMETLKIEEFNEDDIEQSLKQFGFELLQSYVKPEILGLYLIIFKEAKHFPNIALEFYEKGPLLGTLKLSDFFERCIIQGKLKDISAYKLASFFISLLRDRIHLQVVLNVNEPMDENELKEEVDLAVEVFLYGAKR